MNRPLPVATAGRDRGARDPFIDALRALALLGVLVVNAVSYPAGPSGSPLGQPIPADSPAALITLGLVAWLLQGKAYPLLAFLFGYSLALALRQPSVATLAYRRRRMVRLLCLGVLHGALLYAGDILTLYALAGLVLLAKARTPLRHWVAQWRVFGALAIAAWAFGLVLVFTPGTLEAELPPSTGYGAVSDVWNFVALNWGSYWGSLPGALIFFLPEVLMLMTAGVIAGRLRWLTHRRWQSARQIVAWRIVPAALLLNLLYAVLLTQAAASHSSWQWVWLSAGPLAGWLLSAGLGVGFASWAFACRPALVRVLAPLGRYTLSLYVGHSLLCAICFSGPGFAWSLGSVGLVVWAVGLWGICWVLACWAARCGFHGPLERWMIRA